MSIRLWTKWLWVRIPLLFMKYLQSKLRFDQLQYIIGLNTIYSFRISRLAYVLNPSDICLSQKAMFLLHNFLKYFVLCKWFYWGDFKGEKNKIWSIISQIKRFSKVMVHCEYSRTLHCKPNMQMKLIFIKKLKLQKSNRSVFTFFFASYFNRLWLLFKWYTNWM